MSIMLMTTSIGGITSPLSAAARAAGAATVFYTIIDATRPDKTGLKEPDVSASEDLVLQDVNFAYPTRPDLVILNKLSIRFPVGKTTAIVGASGSGKTTIVGLLLRWYEIESLESNDMVGDIRIDCSQLENGNRNTLLTSERKRRVCCGVTALSKLGVGP